MPLASVRVSNRSSPIRRGCSIRRKKWQYSLYIAIFVLSLHPQTERGALVQPVRIRACHARGQGFESPTHRNRRGQIKLLFDLPPSIACTVRLPHNDPDCIQGPRGAGILSGLFWLPVRQFYGTVCYSHGYNLAECPLSGNARDMPSCCRVRALCVFSMRKQMQRPHELWPLLHLFTFCRLYSPGRDITYAADGEIPYIINSYLYTIILIGSRTIYQ